MKLLVTGANGFVGQRVSQMARDRGWHVREAMRRNVEGKHQIQVGNLSGATDWSSAVDGMDAVIHCAAMVHRMDLHSHEAEAEYMAVNRDATLSLALSAAKAGATRLIFISTAMVHGGGGEVVYRVSDEPNPQGMYARSKWQTEQGLKELSGNTNLSITVVRPPLVYGPGVRANFLALMRVSASPWPLPLGDASARRSIVHVDNLVDVALTAVERARNPYETYLVDDGYAPSIAELILRLRAAANLAPRLIPVPAKFMQATLRLCGKEGIVKRLFQSFVIDGSPICHALDWSPPVSQERGLHETMGHFLNQRKGQS